MPSIRALLVLGLIALPARIAWAECGLEHCPRRDVERAGPRIAGTVRTTAFSDDSEDGSYRLYTGTASWEARLATFGVSAAFVTVETSDEIARGARNPLLFAEASVLRTARHDLLLGTQWEIPWGDEDVADRHQELVVYGRYRVRSLRSLDLRAGFRTAISSDDHFEAERAQAAPSTISFHAGHTKTLASYVNPHADRELVWRAAAVAFGPIHAHAQGERVLEGESEGLHFITAGASVDVPIAGSWLLIPSASGPVTRAKRYDWTLGVEVSVRGR